MPVTTAVFPASELSGSSGLLFLAVVSGFGGAATDARGTQEHRLADEHVRLDCTGLPSILAMRASTAAAPSSARGMQTLVTGYIQEGQALVLVEADDRYVPWHRAPASRSAASTPNSWLILPTPQAVGQRAGCAACRLVVSQPPFLGGRRVPDA